MQKEEIYFQLKKKKDEKTDIPLPCFPILLCSARPLPVPVRSTVFKKYILTKKEMWEGFIFFVQLKEL